MDGKLEALGQMGGPALRALWREELGEEPPTTRSTDLLRWRLAWRLQERAYGGLKGRTRRRLNEVQKALKKDAGYVPQGMQHLKPGTTLTRQWQGVKHTVQVLDKGFAHRGKPYPTLSSVARAITGTRWSGPVFFGLKKAPNRARAAR